MTRDYKSLVSSPLSPSTAGTARHRSRLSISSPAMTPTPYRPRYDVPHSAANTACLAIPTPATDLCSSCRRSVAVRTANYACPQNLLPAFRSESFDTPSRSRHDFFRYRRSRHSRRISPRWWHHQPTWSRTEPFSAFASRPIIAYSASLRLPVCMTRRPCTRSAAIPCGVSG